MEYHVFRKTKQLKNGKSVRRWYYYYLDENKKQIQKACKGCKTRKEAEDYIRALPAVLIPSDRIRIEEIARDMYLDGSAHMNRRVQFGRTLDEDTQIEARRYVNYILEKWGRRTLAEIDPTEITKYLFSVNRSGSWKNRFISIFGEIYTESQWYGCRIERPQFQKFIKKTRKANILTTKELEQLFIPSNFPNYEFYLFFMLCLSAGLRLGEIRAVRPKQFLFGHNAIIVDGFCKRDGTRTQYNKKGSPLDPHFRVAMLPDITLKKMAEHISQNNIADDDFCFTIDGLPIRQSRAESVFAAALVKAGIAMSRSAFKQSALYTGGAITKASIIPDGRKLIVHSLRYTYVTRMRRELSAEIVARMVGHLDEKTTDYYTDYGALEEALASISIAGSAADNLFS